MLGQHSTSNPTLQVFVTWLKKKIPSRLKFAISVIAKISCTLKAIKSSKLLNTKHSGVRLHFISLLFL